MVAIKSLSSISISSISEKIYKRYIFFSSMVYKYIDIVGTSNTDITDAVNNAFQEASKTVKNIKWGELGRITFKVEDGKKMEYQTEVRIGFEILREEDRK